MFVCSLYSKTAQEKIYLQTKLNMIQTASFINSRTNFHLFLPFVTGSIDLVNTRVVLSALPHTFYADYCGYIIQETVVFFSQKLT